VSKTIVIGPRESVIDTIVSMIDLERTDLSHTAIVFSGKRPSHFVRKAIGDKLQRSFIPPRVFSIDEFIGSLYQQLHPAPVKHLEAIDAVALLFRVHAGLKERLGGSGFDSLDAFLPVGFKLFGELEELRIANHSDRRITEALAGLSYARLHSLPEYYRGFYELVAERGYVTRSMQYSAVAEQCHNVDLSEFSLVITTGFLAPTNSERQILTELRRRENIVLIYQRGKGLTDHFKELQIEGVTDGSNEEELQPEISLYRTQDTHGQVFALSALMKEKLSRNEPVNEKTVVVLPTPDALFPVYHQTLPLFRSDEYNIALGYPLARTPIYGFVGSLMDLVGAMQDGRFPASAYLRFVLHPYTKNIRFGQRSDVTRILFHALEEFLVRDKSRMYTTLEEIESLDELFTNVSFAAPDTDGAVTPEQLKKHLVSIHDKTIRKFSSFESVGDFARKAVDILLFVYGESTAHLHPMFRSYAETILDMFHGLELSVISTQTFRKPQSYFNFLRRYVTTREVPFSGTPLKGLQVLGLLETRNLLFDDVYVLDVNDDVLPGGIVQEMLLPQGLRERLGLETQGNRERLTEYYFGLLVNGAKRVHLFFTEQDKSEKSRFIEKLLWERQRRGGLQAAKESIRSVRYEVNLANSTPAGVAKSVDVAVFLKNFSYSASALDLYLKCPVKFYYSKVLGLEEKVDVTDDVDNRDIGKLVHAVLRSYFEETPGKPLSKDWIDVSQMERVVNEHFKEHFGTENAGALYLIRRQVARQMESFLRKYQIPILEETQITVEELEYSINAKSNGFNIEGRIDRVEQRGEDVYILDYKTGKDDSYAKVNFKKLDLENRETWGEAISSIQLPFYLLLYTLKTGIDVQRVRPAYVFLGRYPLSREIESEFAEDPNERVEHFRIAREVIFRLINEIADQSKPFLPTSNLQQHCPSCPFSVMCGTQWVQGWNP
jgi:CRISPR/Cas system-associated exonuclease Cas4 (RecB family)